MTVCVMVRECKESSAPGEVPEEVFSDGGSTPPASTNWTLDEHLLFQRRLRRDGVALMSAELRTEDLSSVLIFSHHLCKILVVLYISLSSSKYKK